MLEITQVTGKDGTVRIEISTDDRRAAAMAEAYIEKLQEIMHQTEKERRII